MTLALSEKDVQDLIEMKEVVSAVEEAFRRQGGGEVSNLMRTRSRGRDSLLNVMHSNLAYLGRGGLKAYMSSRGGAKPVFLLFDGSTSIPLAVMGADVIGRYRTGAATGVAASHLYRRSSGSVAIFGSGKQALTQVLALGSVMSLDAVRVWSPNRSHRDAFVDALSGRGYGASAFDSPELALKDADLAAAITSSKEPFLTGKMLGSVSLLNLCGSNHPAHSEADPSAVGGFGAVVVDDLPQAKVEYGDLIRAAEAGTFSWGSAVELSAVVAGKSRPSGRTLFKSGGAALEDVAVASMLYDKAMRSGRSYPKVELV
ncbi:MAG: ornithine cyclodeaminase family protein [Nitrososphaerota archaeon]|nr:ornithine cyclodeaminase family protein [Nitrososphaerota archaeon]MDG7024293.1 ornithine cyclodeaminase family protein [Nitrososphaerota archaeon]